MSNSIFEVYAPESCFQYAGIEDFKEFSFLIYSGDSTPYQLLPILNQFSFKARVKLDFSFEKTCSAEQLALIHNLTHSLRSSLGKGLIVADTRLLNQLCNYPGFLIQDGQLPDTPPVAVLKLNAEHEDILQQMITNSNNLYLCSRRHGVCIPTKRKFYGNIQLKPFRAVYFNNNNPLSAVYAAFAYREIYHLYGYYPEIWYASKSKTIPVLLYELAVPKQRIKSSAVACEKFFTELYNPEQFNREVMVLKTTRQCSQTSDIASNRLGYPCYYQITSVDGKNNNSAEFALQLAKKFKPLLAYIYGVNF